MIVIWEKFVQTLTNFCNLIENFSKVLKKILKVFKKILIKIWKNLTKIWNFFLQSIFLLSALKLCVRGERSPGFPLVPLLLFHVYMIFIIELKIWLQNPPKSGGGADYIEKLSSKIWGGRPPSPRQRNPCLKYLHIVWKLSI